MPNPNSIQQMEALAQKIIEDHDVKSFSEYWDLGKELVGECRVRAFYVRATERYANLAVLTDRAIVDIEADENDADPGSVTVTNIAAIREIDFTRGAVITIPNSARSQLTMVLTMSGSTSTGSYWIAETDEERIRLTGFGSAVMQAINRI